MSQKTTNYNLEKPLQSQFYDVEVQNGNMDKIDEELKKAAVHASDSIKHVTAAERTGWNSKASTAVATTTANGLMASADKGKLNGIAAEANKTVIANNLTTQTAGSAL